MFSAVKNVVRVINKNNVLGGACSTKGAWRGSYTSFVGRREGRRLLGKPRPKWNFRKWDGGMD
jgi:hypothetical protein